MSRLPEKEGGWFKMWGKKWLTDEKLNKIGETAELAYMRVLCLANVLMEEGLFKGHLGEYLTKIEICRMARIAETVFDTLVENGLLLPGQNSCYYIPSWGKHQRRGMKKPLTPEVVSKPAPREKAPKDGEIQHKGQVDILTVDLAQR
jgi:hypothetical protein